MAGADDCDEETGVVEYVEGSHLWPDDGGDGSATSADFHGSSDYQAALKRAAARAGIDESAIPTPTRVPVKAGDAIFHHQAVWHGSARNASTHRPRRALGVHLVRKDVEWRRDRHPDYIYGRYRREGEIVPSDAHFPVVFSSITALAYSLHPSTEAGMCSRVL